jgi:hypothetical protein
MPRRTDTKSIPLHLLTANYQITGFVKAPAIKHGFLGAKSYPKRLSDILFFASERMVKKGELEFINITNAEIQDISSGRVIRSAIPYLAVSKRAIQAIIPMNVSAVDFE